MTSNTRVALIIAGGIILAVCGYIYFSPHRTCMRELEGKAANPSFACTVIEEQ